MKIYKNPFVSRESYFVKTGKARTAKFEASASKGYSIDFIDGKWKVCETAYYDFTLKKELPIVLTKNSDSLIASRNAPEFASYFNILWEALSDERQE